MTSYGQTGHIKTIYDGDATQEVVEFTQAFSQLHDSVKFGMPEHEVHLGMDVTHETMEKTLISGAPAPAPAGYGACLLYTSPSPRDRS